MPVRERALTVKKCWEKQCGRKNTDSCGQFAADPLFCLSKALFVLVILFRMEYNKKTKLKKVYGTENDMERHGFIHDMLDVKVLILYVMNRVLYPVDTQKIYELCLQDDCLSYFDVMQAVPQMVSSGHLEQIGEQFVITDKGRETAAITEDSIAYPVLQRAGKAIERFNREVRRDNFIGTELIAQPGGEYKVRMHLDDELGTLMTLELTAPTSGQARKIGQAFHERADMIYRFLLDELTTEQEAQEDSEIFG